MRAGAAWEARSSGNASEGEPVQGPAASTWKFAPGTAPPSGCTSARGFPSRGFEEDITRIRGRTRSSSPGRSGGRMSPSPSQGRMRFVEGKIVRNEGHGEFFYRLEAVVPEPVEFVPGQFAMVSGWPGNDPLLPRPLAIFRSGGTRGKGTVEFVYKVVGRGTALLSGLHEGDPLSLTLPLGHGFEFPGEDRSWWLVGGGVGFSSVFPAAVALEGERADFEIFLGARTRDQLPPGEWIPGGAIPGRVHLCTDDGTAGFFGTVSAAIRD